jgi:hypothetical protein
MLLIHIVVAEATVRLFNLNWPLDVEYVVTLLKLYNKPPLFPCTPDVPLEPDVPELPDVPLEPDVPELPDEPDVPDEPLAP